MSSIGSFALVVALVTITPGLDTALVLRSALSQDRRHAMATAGGVCLGVLVWAVAAALGVSALLAASQTAHTALRVVGAAYMVVLGIRLLVGAVRGRDRALEDAPPPTPTTPWSGFRTGLFTNLANPKVGAFYVALLPQFIPEDGSALLGGLVLGMVHNLETAVWFALVILGASSVRHRLTHPSSTRWIETITGSVLVLFGVQLARSAR
ncbi:MAG: LysE family translocator [Acidimicrobiales bacterium]|nr:LysE family translocator [Acidimicrobiales bacterium]